jgi:flagellar protein FlbT
VRGLISARDLIGEFKQATTSRLAREILDDALAAAEADECYRALKLIRRIIRHEDAVMGSSRPLSGIAKDSMTCRP